jgi:2,4-dienoyl-CoA reductase-like NADH-dependent reductase (Old Yellow Enzyme family)
MSKLFETSCINGMTLSNRFVRSATWEGMATVDGAVTSRLIETMTALARGGVGLIISSHAYIRPEGQAGPWQLGIYKDELIRGLREMTAAVHDCDGKIVMQLAHSGNFAPQKLTGQPPFVVSSVEGQSPLPHREMTTQDIRELVNAFAEAAQRARSAGFDGVQIHSAHGYLLSQFLSPVFNKREDEYGGTIENRARIHVEVCRAIRQAAGLNCPVLIKLNCSDFVEGGLSLQDSIQAARLLIHAGIDAIELSGGFLGGGKLSPSRPGIDSPAKEAYFREEANAFKKEIGVPLILVGGIRSFEVAKRLIEEGEADYISMSRPLIREPDLINRWKAGDRSRAGCRSDSLCFKPALEGEGMYCVVKKREERNGRGGL